MDDAPTRPGIDTTSLRFYHRRLAGWFLAQFVITGVAVISIVAFWSMCTATELRSRVPWLWAFAMFIPLVNIMAFVILCSRADRAYKAQGFPSSALGW
jgi:hypothetical protein